MSLIDKTYFTKEINIPDSTYNDLTLSIARYEKEILIRLLGYELWKLVDAYDADTSPQRIIDLVVGVEYDVDDNTIKWNGLVNSDLVSLIAYYVFWQYQRNNQTFTTHTGEAKTKKENAEPIGAAQRMSFAWYKCREFYGGNGDDSLVPSAYNFLTEHESDYDEWVFTDLGDSNMFDL